MGGSVKVKWYDIRDDKKRWRAFNIIIGSRGVGKTYSSIDYMMSLDAPFIYLRNKKTQIRKCCTAFGNPFKKWSKNTGREVYIKSIAEDCGLIYERSGEEDILRGYALPLSVFENMRGVDLSDVTHVLFDEFIEKEKLKFDQFSGFMNFYETVNRNRELEGEPPLQIFMLSNAQKLDSPILAGLDLVPQIEAMVRTGQENYSTGNIWFSLPRSAVSEAKKGTALYQIAQGTNYYKEAIENKFANDSFFNVKKQPIIEFTPYACIDGIYLYKHKNGSKYYACNTPAENIPVYDSKINTIMLYRPLYVSIAAAYSTGNLYFSDFLVKSKLLAIIK